MFGYFVYVETRLVPLGTKVVIQYNSVNRTSWAPYSTIIWYTRLEFPYNLWGGLGGREHNYCTDTGYRLVMVTNRLPIQSTKNHVNLPIEFTPELIYNYIDIIYKAYDLIKYIQGFNINTYRSLKKKSMKQSKLFNSIQFLMIWEETQINLHMMS